MKEVCFANDSGQSLSSHSGNFITRNGVSRFIHSTYDSIQKWSNRYPRENTDQRFFIGSYFTDDEELWMNPDSY